MLQSLTLGLYRFDTKTHHILNTIIEHHEQSNPTSQHFLKNEWENLMK